MSTLDLEIRPFSIRTASREDHARLNAFKNILRGEVFPEDPPYPLEEDIERWRSKPTLIKDAAWEARDKLDGRTVAFAEANIYDTGDNEHMIEFNVEVLPELRRQGLGSRLLQRVVEQARLTGRRLLTTECSDRVKAGGAFLERMGGRCGLEAHLNEVRLPDADRALVQRWLDESAQLAASYDLRFLDGRVPQERLQDLVDLLQVVANDQPRDSLDMEDNNFTPETVRQFEEHTFAGGQQRWVFYAIDRKSDRMVGLTEVIWSPHRPALLWQGFTGVMPEQRGHGVGKWLKAEMLSKVLRERPEARVIRTGNANSNAPMLKINVEMGFKPSIAWTIWQVETEAAAKYLAEKA